jgi:hypothetical protein
MSTSTITTVQAIVKAAALASATFDLALNPRATNAHGQSLGGATSKTLKSGAKITTTTAGRILTVTKHASCTATKAYILSAAGAVLSSASFSGNDATFTQDVTATTSYYIAVDANGAAYNIVTAAPAFPIAGTYLSWVGGYVDGADSSSLASVVSVVNVSPYKAPADHVDEGITQEGDADFLSRFPLIQIGMGAASADIVCDGGRMGQIAVGFRYLRTIDTTADETFATIRDEADKIVQEMEATGTFQIQGSDFPAAAAVEGLRLTSNPKLEAAYQDALLRLPYLVDP